MCAHGGHRQGAGLHCNDGYCLVLPSRRCHIHIGHERWGLRLDQGHGDVVHHDVECAYRPRLSMHVVHVVLAWRGSEGRELVGTISYRKHPGRWLVQLLERTVETVTGQR